MTNADKDEVEDSFNLKTSMQNIMYDFFYSNTSEFAGSLEKNLDKGAYKTSVLNMHELGWKENYFNSADLSMLFHGCGGSQYPQFYDKTKNIYQILPRPYVGRYSGEKGHQFLQENWILILAK